MQKTQWQSLVILSFTTWQQPEICYLMSHLSFCPLQLGSSLKFVTSCLTNVNLKWVVGTVEQVVAVEGTAQAVYHWQELPQVSFLLRQVLLRQTCVS